MDRRGHNRLTGNTKNKNKNKLSESAEILYASNIPKRKTHIVYGRQTILIHIEVQPHTPKFVAQKRTQPRPAITETINCRTATLETISQELLNDGICS